MTKFLIILDPFGNHFFSLNLAVNLAKARTPIDMDGALHTDFTKFETSGGIKIVFEKYFIPS